MGITAITGPSVVFGLTQTSTGGVQEYNEERGPSMFDCGQQLADPRAPYVYRPGNPVGTDIYGFWRGDAVVDCSPGTVNSTVVALPTATPVAGTAFVLSSVNNSVVTIGVQLTPADGSSVRTVIALDSTYAVAPRGLTWGTPNATIASWDPTTALQRQLVITRGASVDDTGATYTIQGFDQYGYKVTETITGTSSTSGSTTYTTRKTYKYIQSITPAGTISATNVGVGVNDTYGFPIAVHQAPYVDIWSGPSSGMNRLTAQTSLITFGSTITQTATTADIRGTWASTIASNSTSATPQRIFMRCIPAAQDVVLQSQTYLSTGQSAWLGFPQYSS